MSVPSPADAPSLSAAEAIAHVRRHGGRVFRFRQPPKTFALTTDRDLAEWIVKNGGRTHVPRGFNLDSDGSYLRARGGTREWDLWLTPMRVTDEGERGQAIWKAAA